MSAAAAQLAGIIRSQRLVTPALLLLEAHRPLAGILHAGLLFCAPLLKFCGSKELLKNAEEILTTPEGIAELIAALEEDSQ